MSLQNKGGVKLAKLSEASSKFEKDIIDNSLPDDRYHIIHTSMDVKDYNWYGLDF